MHGVLQFLSMSMTALCILQIHTTARAKSPKPCLRAHLLSMDQLIRCYFSLSPGHWSEPCISIASIRGKRPASVRTTSHRGRSVDSTDTAGIHFETLREPLRYLTINYTPDPARPGILVPP